jgi:hypothetical protein
MSEVYLLDQDYQATISVSEAGLVLVNRYRNNTGSDLTLYVTLQLKDVANDYTVSENRSMSPCQRLSFISILPSITPELYAS